MLREGIRKKSTLTGTERQIVVFGNPEPRGTSRRSWSKGCAVMGKGRQADPNRRFHGWWEAVTEAARTCCADNGAPSR